MSIFRTALRSRAGAAVAAAGLATMSSGLVVLNAGSASAAEGTVKIGEPGTADTANDPLVGCEVQVTWAGWTPGMQARVEFSMQAPTSSPAYSVVPSSGPDELVDLSDGSAVKTYTLAFSGDQPPVHGSGNDRRYHVAVDVYTPAAGSSSKSKTVWVSGDCGSSPTDGDVSSLVATPREPTVNQSPGCGVEGSYEILETPHVSYLLDGREIAAGPHDGPVDGELTAQAEDGYTLASPFSFPLQISKALACDTAVTPLEPNWGDPTCASPHPSFSLPPVDGISYSADDSTPSPGQTVTVTASVLSGYVLATGATTQWAHTFGPAPTGCDKTPSTPGTDDPKGSDTTPGENTGGGSSDAGNGGQAGEQGGSKDGSKGGQGGKVRSPEILGVEAESHQPGTTGISLKGVTTVVSSHKAVSGGVAVPTAVEAGLASYGKRADERSRLFGGLQLTVGGALFLAGGWGLRRRPRRD